MEIAKATIAECTDQSYMERVRYYPRQLLTAEDMLQEQRYFIEKLRRHNRFIHGWGIVCGLIVKAAPTEQARWNVLICPGYALGAYGDEIYVSQEYKLDLANCLTPSEGCTPCNQKIQTVNGENRTIYVVIKYSECKTRPQRTLPTGCGCDESACEYSRIRDGFEIRCISTLPESHSKSFQDLEKQYIAEGLCPPCPKDPWLVLARIDLPNDLTASKVDDSMIQHAERIILHK